MSSTQSLARIRLPSHHPVVQGLKKGGSIKIHAVREDTEEDNMIGKEAMPGHKGPRPIPLERGFHVTKIEPAAVGREPSEDQQKAVKYLSRKMSGTGGRDVS